MAVLRRRTSTDSPNAHDRVKVPVDAIVDTTYWSSLSAPERALVRQLRATVGQASQGTPFDVRCVLSLEGDALRVWLAARREWVQAMFHGDDRVRGT